MEENKNLPGINSIHPLLSVSNLSFLNSLLPENAQFPIQKEEIKKSPDSIFSSPKPIISDLEIKKSRDNELLNLTKFTEISQESLSEFCSKNNFKPDEFCCPICREQYISENSVKIIKFSQCENHFFHLECALNLLGNENFIKCPICNIIYGILIGDMPPGNMVVSIFPKEIMSCESFENFGTIEITYMIPSGLFNGQKFSGTNRKAYLPDTPEGREILKLLKIAFDRKLTFTIGTSTTLGKKNTVIWNGIHHKTATGGGTKFFGYPDDTYFTRVRQELALKGIF